MSLFENHCFYFSIISLVIFGLQRLTLPQIRALEILFWPYFIIFSPQINICWAIMSRKCIGVFCSVFRGSMHTQLPPGQTESICWGLRGYWASSPSTKHECCDLTSPREVGTVCILENLEFMVEGVKYHLHQPLTWGKILVGYLFFLNRRWLSKQMNKNLSNWLLFEVKNGWYCLIVNWIGTTLYFFADCQFCVFFFL